MVSHKNNILIAYIYYDTQRTHHPSGSNRWTSFLYLAFVLGKWCITPLCPCHSAQGSHFHLHTIKEPETGCNRVSKLSWWWLLHPPHLLLSPVLRHILASVLCVFTYQPLQLQTWSCLTCVPSLPSRKSPVLIIYMLASVSLKAGGK